MKKKRLLLGVCGGIAAYKCLELVRLCQQQCIDVRVVMTDAATRLISPICFQALSQYPVLTHLWPERDKHSINSVNSVNDKAVNHGMVHIDLAKWADFILIAPATANRISKIAHGQADDLLGNILLASTAKLFIAPAMNVEMWQNSATQDNIAILKRRGIPIVGPDVGEQACGDVGFGRLVEPQQIVNQLLAQSNSSDSTIVKGRTPQKLAFQSILITCGATQEAIDPVRFISNASSGKMGIALAHQASEQNVRVTLVYAHVDSQLMQSLPRSVNCIKAINAESMLAACMKESANHDVMIGTAAVADYRPAHSQQHKIKKLNAGLTLQLKPNVDIIKTIANQAEAPFMVGFALESEQLIEHAKAKLIEKKLDLILANKVEAINADSSQLTALWWKHPKEDHKEHHKEHHEINQQVSLVQDKSKLAEWVIQLINQLYSR